MVQVALESQRDSQHPNYDCRQELVKVLLVNIESLRLLWNFPVSHVFDSVLYFLLQLKLCLNFLVEALCYDFGGHVEFEHFNQVAIKFFLLVDMLDIDPLGLLPCLQHGDANQEAAVVNALLELKFIHVSCVISESGAKQHLCHFHPAVTIVLLH